MSRHFNFKDRTGEKHKTNQGYEIEILKYVGDKNCTILFNDEKSTILNGVHYGNILRGNVRNPYSPTFFGVGFTGVGEYKSRTKCGSIWSGMLERAYGEKYHTLQPTYKDVEVCENWKNLQIFSLWFHKNYINGWHLDKDIIVKNNKIYSPQTCAFVPREVNNLFTSRKNHRNNLPIGVSKDKGTFRATSTQNKKQVYFGNYGTPEEAFYAYKKGKESYIKEVAEKWKEQIDERVYNAMMNWKIEITD